MKKLLLLLFIALSGCASSGQQISIKQRYKNVTYYFYVETATYHVDYIEQLSFQITSWDIPVHKMSFVNNVTGTPIDLNAKNYFYIFSNDTYCIYVYSSSGY